MTASLYICFESAADLSQDVWKYGIQGLLTAISRPLQCAVSSAEG
jgi:hypothetical protein